ncbi:MAG: hypothetical protein ACFB00_01430 [Parvularculaceae bacterium]
MTAASPWRERLSRRAELDRIDAASRRARAGLALVALAAAALSGGAAAGVFGPPAHWRVAIWLALLAPALAAGERLRRSYRFGGAATARPFRWRARYAARLAIISAALGAGAPLLAADAEATALRAILLATAFVAATLHAASPVLAAAAFLPALGFLTASLAGSPAEPATLALGLAALGGLAVLAGLARRRATAAMARYPRAAAAPHEFR